ncbi:hypothetical protein EV363DRAFT_1224557, partial [Boletus edulis]
MAPLSIFQLPLSKGGPPPGYDWEQCGMSVLSVSEETTTFDTGVDRRDTFLGQRRCVVCGISFYPLLEHAYICQPDCGGRGQVSQYTFWDGLKKENWIPLETEDYPEDDPHNGLLMCANHRILFERHYFFIRYFPEASIIPFLHYLIQKFVFINYCGNPDDQQFHGKAIALDVKDYYAPYPSLFILHELRVRAHRLFRPIDPDIPDATPDVILWQDWILSDGVFNEGL